MTREEMRQVAVGDFVEFVNTGVRKKGIVTSKAITYVMVEDDNDAIYEVSHDNLIGSTDMATLEPEDVLRMLERIAAELSQLEYKSSNTVMPLMFTQTLKDTMKAVELLYDTAADTFTEKGLL